MRLVMAATLLAALLAGGEARGADEIDVAPAITAAGAWLEQVDGGRFAQAWQRSAPVFQSRVAEREWEKLVAGIREPLGGVVWRRMRAANYLRTPPGAPEGDYVVIQYDTEFRNRLATETVSTVRGEDNAWRVTGYFIR